MELGWKNAGPNAGPNGEKAKPNTSYSGQGLEIKETFSTSGRGRKMSLTSPLIEQALAQACAVCSPKTGSMSVIAILRQLETRSRLGSPVRSGSWCNAQSRTILVRQGFPGTHAEAAPFRRSRVKKLLAVLIVGSWLLSGTAARAQTPAQKESATHVISNQDMDLLRKDLRSKRKQLIAANLKLTDTEATKFWPVYDQYIVELITINDRKFGLIQEYADNWGKLTNEQSLLFTRNWLDMDIAIAQLRQKYVPMVAKVLDGTKAATFFQLDRRIAMMMELQVSSQMPLVQEQESSSKSAN